MLRVVAWRRGAILAASFALCGVSTMTLTARAQRPHDKGAPPPTAGAEAEAAERFRRALALYKERDFRAALQDFRRAYDLSPNFRVLYNIGAVYSELKDHAKAIAAFREYLAQGGANVPADRRAAVEKELTRLTTRVAPATVTSSVDGAEIVVDDDPVGTTPLASAILLNPGRHRIVARKDGYTPAQRIVDVAEGDKPTVGFELASIPQQPPAPAPPLAPPASPASPAPPPPDAIAPSSRSTWMWLGAGTTVALAGGAVATGLVAQNYKSQRDTALGSYPGDPSRLQSLHDKANSFAVVSTALSFGAAATAIGTVVLYFVDRSASPPKTASTQLRIGTDGRRIVLSGAF